ncbi:U1 small nuclear ribonucleoprotein C [Galdieria sulphuraria]|uniref:U1 small nuclear ribonucleoprotein C n=1 Tax=Galdieria sulphuraria TaxID=130081 RepID=M2XIJ0_GALSU|nr:U1 small nuclear ribonucleoprotein C [Galdieria sulphuraria]EME29902.1 U1 small nuclear ribonucleoprotein C [Galdieria sulphuraria]GJD11951.1 U1 small nuclear ribonucleoprotein C [Galdieria sulphuraria]|eukprot:XP_005706422.1 U1 small nuclear ribonucleoprotein C [Galdieria sulphuraria]
MGKYYCDYCDVYLTHDSPAVRKQHNDGNRHRMNFAEYYRQFIGESLQQQIDAVVYDFERRVALGLVVPTYGFATTVQSSSTLPVGFNPLFTQYETFTPSYYTGNATVYPPSFGASQPPTQQPERTE